jgi:RNA polymerase sigma factor (sigma-70 family)
MPAGISREHAREVLQLYREEAGALFRYGYRRLAGDRGAAEDVVQEVFEAAAHSWCALRGLNGEQRRAWLFTVARNKAADRWKVDQRLVPGLDLMYPALEPVDRVDICSLVMDSVVLDKCWKVVKGMPDRQHQVAWLHWHDGFGRAEVAKLLGISRTTVRVHLMNASRALRSAVGHELRFVEDTDNRDGIGGAEA